MMFEIYFIHAVYKAFVSLVRLWRTWMMFKAQYPSRFLPLPVSPVRKVWVGGADCYSSNRVPNVIKMI